MCILGIAEGKVWFASPHHAVIGGFSKDPKHPAQLVLTPLQLFSKAIERIILIVIKFLIKKQPPSFFIRQPVSEDRNWAICWVLLPRWNHSVQRDNDMITIIHNSNLKTWTGPSLTFSCFISKTAANLEAQVPLRVLLFLVILCRRWRKRSKKPKPGVT